MEDARRALPVRPLRLARRRGRPRLRARDADARADRHLLVRRTSAGDYVGPDAAARAVAHVVRRQRRAVRVERPLAQRGPRQLVRVPLRRGARASSTTTPRTIPDRTGYADFDELMHAVYAHGDQWRARLRPGRAADRAPTRCSTCRSTTAARSCSTRCARWSARATFQRIERAWVARYRDRVGDAPTTSSRSPRRSRTATCAAFLRAWVYGTKTPPMPGHPDWKADPVTTTPPALANRASQPARPRR